MSSNNPIQEVRVVAEDRSGIVTHPREIMDLKELFVILTYHCNGNCEYCIERNVYQKGMISGENFEKAIAFAKEKGLTTISYTEESRLFIPISLTMPKKLKMQDFW